MVKPFWLTDKALCLAVLEHKGFEPFLRVMTQRKIAANILRILFFRLFYAIMHTGDETMKQVRILLSGNTNLQYYVDAVNAAGGEATAKYLPDISTDYDGFILCGGNDIDPKYYHQKINGSVDIDSQRDAVEFSLLKAFVDSGKPILGICRGYQLINIFFGGSLHQDLPEKYLHTNKQDFYITHRITAEEGSMLFKLYGPSFVVNSSHHQAVDRLGNDLFATSHWNDTYIEGFEHCFKPIYGVQWHPERMCVRQQRADTVDGIKVFEWFLNVCREKPV